MQCRTFLLTIAVLGAAAPLVALAQARVPPPAGAATLAEGWGLLAKGDAAGAALIAWQELARDQHSAAALVLAVDATVVEGGATAGLNTYEKWLGSRKIDAAHVLRRVARALLVEPSAQSGTTARIEALRALAADGDQAAAATLEQAAFSSGFGETRALASLGNERAINILIAQLGFIPGSKTPVIDALGSSGSALPVAPLRALLSDPSDLNRAAAADALGRLGATAAVPQLKALLHDQVFTVRLKAAGALLRLEDPSGLRLLADLALSEHAAVRVAAARELGSQPDAAWHALVRSLTADPDPTVRLDAARLIAPYDQPLARSVLDGLLRNDNVGIREAASGVLVERVASDFATLRALLRSADVIIRIRAAGRILELTR